MKQKLVQHNKLNDPIGFCLRGYDSASSLVYFAGIYCNINQIHSDPLAEDDRYTWISNRVTYFFDQTKTDAIEGSKKVFLVHDEENKSIRLSNTREEKVEGTIYYRDCELLGDEYYTQLCLDSLSMYPQDISVAIAVKKELDLIVKKYYKWLYSEDEYRVVCISIDFQSNQQICFDETVKGFQSATNTLLQKTKDLSLYFYPLSYKEAYEDYSLYCLSQEHCLSEGK